MEWNKVVDSWPTNNAIGYEQVNGMEWNKVVDSWPTTNTMGYQQGIQRSGIRKWTADLPTMQWGTNKKVNAME